MKSAALDSATLGARLRYVRGQKNQKDFAAALGIATGTYQNYERDDRVPDADVFARLVRLGWNANWLLVGIGPEKLEGIQGKAHGFGDDAGVDGSHRPRLNQQTLQSALEVVESGLEALDQDMTSEGKARLVGLVYDRMDRNEAPTPAQVVGFVLKAIKEATSAGGSTGGR